MLRRSGIAPEAQRLFSRIIDTVIDDFDRQGRQPATRAKYRILVESLAVENDSRSIADIAVGQPNGGLGTVPVAGETDALARTPTAGTLPSSLGAIEEMIRKAVTNAVRDAGINPAAKDLLSTTAPRVLRTQEQGLEGNKHSDEIASKISIFIRVAGDNPIHAYTQQDMRAFRNLMDQMPTRALQYFKSDDPAIVIPLNKARRMPFPPISPTTVNAKYLSAVRGLFSHLVDNKVIPHNPLDGVAVRTGSR